MTPVHIPNNQAARNDKTEQDKGKALRKADVQVHIDTLEDRKKSLIAQGRQLMSEGKQDTPEYDKLVEQHRFLRGKQRFFEDAQADIDKDSSDSSRESNKDRTKMPEKNALEKGSEALDRLYKEANE